MTITGTSLDDPNATVMVDSVPCTVKMATFDTIMCETGPKLIGSNLAVQYVGQHGVRRVSFNATTEAVTYDNYKLSTQVKKEELATNLEETPTGEHYMVNSFYMYSGFFEAPVTGKYQFHMSCDDNCSWKMSLTTPNDPSTLEELLSMGSHSSFRKYNSVSNDVTDTANANIGKHFSQWIDLVQGTKYYFESPFGQGGGEAHYTVGFEVEPANAADATGNNKIKK